jgi:hypothetical protein
MNDNGMLPRHNCKQCGKPLNADGGHPAELYAGTYTGLCYTCEKSGERLIFADTLDGAQTWEFPPHCPAWRRSRERFIGYSDCKQCGGKGRLWSYQSDSLGGNYTIQCADCAARYWAHPLRFWESERAHTIGQAARNLYYAELRRRKLLKAAKSNSIPADVLEKIQTPIRERWDHALSRFVAEIYAQFCRVAPCKQFAKGHGETGSPERQRYGAIYPWAEIAGKPQGAMIF